MKKILTLLSIHLLVILQLCAQVPNGGFENWTGGNPDNWRTTNQTGVVTPVTAVSPSHSGNFALKGEVVSLSGQAFTPALTDVDSNGIGVSVSTRYDKLNFYYK